MRLEIGPGGKIIGTKRVSPNGQVSGLSDLAGREVLIVLLEDASTAGGVPVGGPAGWGDAVNEQMRRAFEQYQSLQDLYSTPWEATRAFLQSVFPWAPLPSLTDQVNRWIEHQVSQSMRGPSAPPNGPGSSSESSSGPSDTKASKAEHARATTARRKARGRT
jgi:hypothetical protein